MRPLKLTIRAFGPYLEEQVLDFSELGGRGLLLVHGETGAGKTTLLDALCFALFGETSGGDRKGEQMRNGLAGPGQPTEVEFEFDLRGDRYRVVRSPSYEREKKKGTGRTKEEGRATLEKLGAETEVLAVKQKEVTERVEGLLRMTRGQFTQVAVLPQGKFREFLSARSDAREDILKRLFDSSFYEAIQERLKWAAAELERFRKEHQFRLEGLLRSSGAQSPEALEALLGAEREAAARAAQEAETLERVALEAGLGLQKGKEAARLLQEREEARAAFSKLESQGAATEAKRGRLERSRRAGTLVEGERALRDREREAAEAASALGRAEAGFARASEVLSEASEARSREEARAGEREASTRRALDLERWVILAEGLAPLRQEAAEAKRLEGASAARADKAKAGRAAAQVQHDSQQALAVDLKAKAASADALAKEAKRLEGELQDRASLDDILAKRAEAADLAETAQRKLKSAEEALEASAQALGAQEAAWQAGQAALLAEGLEPGAPCPVCGSAEHPAPAISAGPVPTESRLKAARKAHKEAGETRDRLARERVRAMEDLGILAAQEEGLRSRLGEAAALALEEVRRLAAEARGAALAAGGAQRSLADIEKRMEGLRGQIQASEAEQAKSEEEIRRAQGVETAARTRLEEREAALPPEMRDPAAVRNSLARERERAEALQSALDASRLAHEKASAEFARAKEALGAARDAEARLRERASDAGKRFRDSLATQGFPSEAEWRGARLSDAEQDAMDGALRRYGEELGAAKDRLERAAAAVQGVEAPDLDVLARADADSRAARDRAKERVGAMRQRLESLVGIRDSVGATATYLRELDARYAVEGRLSKSLNGENSQKVTLQRYALAWALEEVLVSANARLSGLSSGRYSLVRAVESPDRRYSGGLDLEVFDSHTGKPRATETLSGGEGFLASLALALGLADTVRAHSGGVQLDAVFIDEGFGNLDQGTLDRAMDTLADLQEGGKLVGVISHLADLRERIDARLEVRKGKRGASTARFVVA